MNQTIKQIVNPFLPGWEYIPDGEPHVFDNRVYIYGSHDFAGGSDFCLGDYVVWSAPVEDLRQWEFGGVIYKKNQDPFNSDGTYELFAPDVCKGADGRYYLYYCLSYVRRIGIAVSDSPIGPFKFYDYVQDTFGELWTEDLPFDPGILFEDNNNIWLYTGFGCDPTNFDFDIHEMINNKNISKREQEKIKNKLSIAMYPSRQSSCLKLAPDMKTVLKVSKIAPVHEDSKGTSFEEHPFFEASSIRKIKDTYYFIYSSIQGHELCYATSSKADAGFVFGGVIISNGDIGYNGNTEFKTYTANNHGSIEQINGQWFVFYHRHTHKTKFSRQACAEPIEIFENGSIAQVEMTSSGLNNGPLFANYRYSSHIVCNLVGPEGAHPLEDEYKIKDNTPYILQQISGRDINPYITNLQNGSYCTVKYLYFRQENKLRITLKGKGTVLVRLDSLINKPIAEICFNNTQWTEYETSIPSLSGIHSVFFCIGENSNLEFLEWEFIQ